MVAGGSWVRGWKSKWADGAGAVGGPFPFPAPNPLCSPPLLPPGSTPPTPPGTTPRTCLLVPDLPFHNARPGFPEACERKKGEMERIRGAGTRQPVYKEEGWHDGRDCAREARGRARWAGGQGGRATAGEAPYNREGEDEGQEGEQEAEPAGAQGSGGWEAKGDVRRGSLTRD